MDSSQRLLIDLPNPLPPHPAKYTETLLPVLAEMLAGRRAILDPFAGTGRIFKLRRWLGEGVRIEGVEIEPEWAAYHPRTTLGNALHLPWSDDTFDAICTSPAYGNRMADPLLLDGTQRNTYANSLGRNLRGDNGASLQWGDKYRSFHYHAWREARRVLEDGGAFVLNIKDHYREGKRMPVTDWHIGCLRGLGFEPLRHEEIPTPGQRYGQNNALRVPYESVILFSLEAA